MWKIFSLRSIKMCMERWGDRKIAAPPHSAIFISLFFSAMIFLLTACDYGRMKEQEALHPYKEAMPEMPAGTVPIEGGIQVLRETRSENLRNPFPYNQQTVSRGKEQYGYYCIMCHGPRADGNGTVGQSFFPLPTSLRSPYVQNQSDGELFFKISLGFRRHPSLASSVAEEGRWLIIHYIRSLGNYSKG